MTSVSPVRATYPARLFLVMGRTRSSKSTSTESFWASFQRPRVGAGELPALGENRRQQGGVIALGREGDSDVTHFAQLTGAVAELPLELVGPHLLVEVLVGAPHSAQQRGSRRIGRKIEVEIFVLDPLRLLAQPHADDGRTCVERGLAAVAAVGRIDEDDPQRRPVLRKLLEALDGGWRDRFTHERVGVLADWKVGRVKEPQCLHRRPERLPEPRLRDRSSTEVRSRKDGVRARPEIMAPNAGKRFHGTGCGGLFAERRRAGGGERRAGQEGGLPT
jgi:hypothetical protein